jgi:hypothetical protein
VVKVITKEISITCQTFTNVTNNQTTHPQATWSRDPSLTTYVNDRYAALLQNYLLTSLDPSTWSRDLSFSFPPEVAKNHSQIYLTSLDPSTWSRDLSFSSPPEVAKNHSQNSPGHVTPPFSPPLEGAVRHPIKGDDGRYAGSYHLCTSVNIFDRLK